MPEKESMRATFPREFAYGGLMPHRLGEEGRTTRGWGNVGLSISLCWVRQRRLWFNRVLQWLPLFFPSSLCQIAARKPSCLEVDMPGPVLFRSQHLSNTRYSPFRFATSITPFNKPLVATSRALQAGKMMFSMARLNCLLRRVIFGSSSTAFSLPLALPSSSVGGESGSGRLSGT